MTTEDTIIDTKQVAPPYTSFQTVKTAVGMFKEHGLPGQIDRSVLGNFSGAVQGQLLPALRFLGLISDDSHVPTAALKRLVDVSGTDGWSSELADILKAAYAPIFTLKLDTASPAQFNDKFKTSYPSVEGDTLRKSVTFFLNAVREAGIPVSAYVMKNKKPRLAPTKRRVAKDKNPNDTPATPLPPLPGHDPAHRPPRSCPGKNALRCLDERHLRSSRDGSQLPRKKRRFHSRAVSEAEGVG